ncbi:MAG: aldo/keto reductase [Halobaculum sp.]
MVDYRRLGSTGTKVSPICFGTWRFGKESDGVVETDKGEAHELLDAYSEAGGNFVDTANVYGDPPGTCEEYIGDWLATRDRDRYVLASKVYFGVGDGPNESGLSRPHIRRQIEGTLDRLGTDYLDVYYIHRWDEETPIEETLATLDELVADGRVNYIGASSMAAWKLTKALWTSDVDDYERFEVTQPMFHAAYRETEEYLEVCADQEIAVCPYSPLAGGFLTGKYERGPDGEAVGPEGSRAELVDYFQDAYVDDRGWRVLDAIRRVAEETDATPAQVALRWLIERPDFTCIPIIGARTVEQMEENMGALDVSLTDDQRERITEAREAEA